MEQLGSLIPERLRTGSSVLSRKRSTKRGSNTDDYGLNRATLFKKKKSIKIGSGNNPVRIKTDNHLDTLDSSHLSRFPEQLVHRQSTNRPQKNKLYLACTSLNFAGALKIKKELQNLDSYKMKDKNEEYLQHFGGSQKSHQSINPQVNISNQMFLASLKQSKYGDRPISSKMQRRRVQTSNEKQDQKAPVGMRNPRKEHSKARSNSAMQYNSCKNKLGFEVDDIDLDANIKIKLNKPKMEPSRPYSGGFDNIMPLKFGSKLESNFINLFSK